MSTTRLYQYLQITLLFGSIGLITACATTAKTDSVTTAGANGVDTIDPYENINRKVYTFNEGLDEQLIKPVSTKYVEITSEPVRTGVTNFFNNLTYINVIINSSLQGKLDQSLSDMFRFLFNTTIGVVGIFDVATEMGLTAHKEDIGQTLAVWGVKQGPYLTLPLFGPNTVRDSTDIVATIMLNPITYLLPQITIPATTLNIINRRAGLLKASSIRDVAALDGYSFSREAYLQQRMYLIYDGNPPSETSDDYDDFFNENFFDQPADDGILNIR